MVCIHSIITPVPRPLVMLDLCSGLHGASQAMRERGWVVYSVDIEAWTKPTVCASILDLPFAPFPVDLLWASVPCTEYSREDQPWTRTGKQPDPTLWQAACRIRDEWRPRFYCFENVRGAARWWGPPTFRYRSRYLWTDLPMLGQCPEIRVDFKKGVAPGPEPRYWRRSRIQWEISEAVCSAVEAFR